MSRDDEKDTYTLVKQTAEQLLKAGRAREISVRRIAETIRYGSSTTINKALDSWWSELGDRLAEYERLPGIPEALQTQMAQLLTTLQRTAVCVAKESLAEFERQAAQRVESMQEKLEAESIAKAAAERKAQGLIERVDGLEARLHGLDSLLAAEQARREAAERRAQEARADAEQVRREAHALAQEFQRQQTLEQARFAATEQRLMMNIDEYKTASQRLEKLHQERERGWRATERALHERLSGTEQAKRRLDVEMAAQQRERDTLARRLQETEETLATLRAELEQERIGRAELIVALTAAKQQVETATQRAQRLEEKLLTLASRRRGKETPRDDIA